MNSGSMDLLLANDIECIQVINDDTAHIQLGSALNSDLYISNTFGGPYNQLFNPVTSNGGTTIEIGGLINQSQVLWYFFSTR